MDNTEPDFNLATDGRAVTLTWPDRTASLTAHALRRACRCAWCTRARRAGEAVGTAAAITGFEPMGGGAAHIVFSDGHRTGLFPWHYLRELATATASLECTS